MPFIAQSLNIKNWKWFFLLNVFSFFLMPILPFHLFHCTYSRVPPKNKRKSSMFVVGKLRLELTHIYLNISVYSIHKTSLGFYCGFFSAPKKNGIWPQIIPPCIHFLLLLLSFPPHRYFCHYHCMIIPYITKYVLPVLFGSTTSQRLRVPDGKTMKSK